MSLTLICPNLSCGRTVVVPEDARGRTVRCPYCRKPFVVPDQVSPKPANDEASSRQS
jgi:hypothetical protein